MNLPILNGLKKVSSLSTKTVLVKTVNEPSYS